MARQTIQTQEIIFAKPQQDNKSMVDLQNSHETVQALSLLSAQEQRIVSKTAAFIVVKNAGVCYTVPPHVQVPATSTVVRTATGALVGISAVVGG